jgi:putative transposase
MNLLSLVLAMYRGMAKRRLFISGLSHHVWHRGNNKTDVYKDDHDRTVFLWLLGDAAQRHDVKIHSWTQMTTHYHALVTSPGEHALPQMMQRLGKNYVQYFNRRHKRTGTLWEGRYGASLVIDERYWARCLRYIETNAVAANIVTKPEDHAWTSYRHHAFGMEDDLIAPHPLYDALGDTPERRQAEWRALCGQPLEAEHVALITEALRTNRPLKGPGFVAKVQ